MSIESLIKSAESLYLKGISPDKDYISFIQNLLECEILADGYLYFYDCLGDFEDFIQCFFIAKKEDKFFFSLFSTNKYLPKIIEEILENKREYNSFNDMSVSLVGNYYVDLIRKEYSDKWKYGDIYDNFIEEAIDNPIFNFNFEPFLTKKDDKYDTFSHSLCEDFFKHQYKSILSDDEKLFFDNEIEKYEKRINPTIERERINRRRIEESLLKAKEEAIERPFLNDSFIKQDYISKLQTLSQKEFKVFPKYEFIGIIDNKTFVIEVTVKNHKARGLGLTKKIAKQKCSYELYKLLQ